MHTIKRNLLTALILSSLAPIAGLSQALPAPTTTPPSDDPTVLDSIVIIGRRAADRRAIDDKRMADGQIDSIQADDVGRLPDQNVAEAARRLPGITTINDQGEGRFLTVRGIDPSLLNVTLNGQTAAAPEPNGRQVKLDDIPSALIGSVTVVKTLTADLDANAIAGQVDIQTLTAFDREESFVTARAAAGHLDLHDGKSGEYDVTAGGKFGADEQFGAVVALNYSDRDFSSEQFAGSETTRTINGNQLPTGVNIRHYSPERKRAGAVANLDWRPSASSKMFLRLLYSSYRDEENRQNFGITLPSAVSAYSNQTATTGNFTGARSERRSRQRAEDTSTKSASAGGEFKFGDRSDSTFSVVGTYSLAEKRDPRRDEWTFRTGSNVPGSYDLSDRLYSIMPGPAAYDPAAHRAYQVRNGERAADEDLYQGKADYEWPFDLGSRSFFKTGVKYVDRTKVNDEQRFTYRQNSAGTLTLGTVPGPLLGSIFSGDYYGPSIDHRGADEYFAANPTHFTYQAASSLADSLTRDYRIKERIAAAYFMANMSFDALSIIPGVRVERTQGDFEAKSVTSTSTLTQGYDSFGSRSYTEWFPSINARYDIGESIVARAAITKAIGRPNYEDLAPYVNIEDVSSNNFHVTKGNPDLNPLLSTNYDIALEYYFGNRGIVSAAFFRKEITDAIFVSTVNVEGGTFAGQVLPNAQVTSPVNVGTATVSGIEFNAQMELTFLPYPFDGLSAGASLTLIDSDASGVPGRTDSVPLALQSDRVASAQLSYEKNKFAARLAYTYRSNYLVAVGSDPLGDIYTGNFGQLDARVSYAATKNVAVFLEGSNLNDAPFRAFYGRDGRVSEFERYGWSARVGVVLSF